MQVYLSNNTAVWIVGIDERKSSPLYLILFFEFIWLIY